MESNDNNSHSDIKIPCMLLKANLERSFQRLEDISKEYSGGNGDSYRGNIRSQSAVHEGPSFFLHELLEGGPQPEVRLEHLIPQHVQRISERCSTYSRRTRFDG